MFKLSSRGSIDNKSFVCLIVLCRTGHIASFEQMSETQNAICNRKAKMTCYELLYQGSIFGQTLLGDDFSLM